jgi:NitT/TauT family transport system permease protein
MTHLTKSPETTSPTTAPAAKDPDAPVNDRDALLKWLPFISTPILLIILIGGWQFAVSVIGVSRFILPAPLDVWRSLADLVTGGTVWHDVWITLWEVIVGFIVALIVGTAVGAVLGRVVWLERAVQPALVALQVVPKVAFIPIFVIWFGFGTTSKIIMAAILAFFPIMLNVMLGVRSVDRGHRDVMRGLGASKWATFRNLELPSTLPYIFAGAEVGIVFAVIGAIVGE